MTILFIILALTRLVFAQNLPAPTGHVNDYANLLSPAYKQVLEQELTSFDATSQISVVTIETLNGDSIENYAQKLFKQWGIGDKKKDNGLLFLISKQDRKVRLEVGYGLEPILPDGLAGEILRNQVTPSFKAGNYEAGVSSGLSEIKRIITANQPYVAPVTPAKSNSEDIFGLGVFILFIIGPYLAAFLARSKSIYAGGIIGAVLGFIFWSVSGLIILTLLGLILDLILSKNYDRFKKLGIDTGFKSTHGGFWGSSSRSSGGGFGGFGGGSSGGGGSSSSW